MTRRRTMTHTMKPKISYKMTYTITNKKLYTMSHKMTNMMTHTYDFAEVVGNIHTKIHTQL